MIISNSKAIQVDLYLEKNTKFYRKWIINDPFGRTINFSASTLSMYIQDSEESGNTIMSLTESASTVINQGTYVETLQTSSLMSTLTGETYYYKIEAEDVDENVEKLVEGSIIQS